MKAKKILLSTIIATQVLTATVLAAPDEAIKEFKKVAPIKQKIKHFQGEVKLFIIKYGKKVRVDQKMTDGLRVVGGRTCVGVRDLVNAIEGAKVEWDGTNHIVDITYGGKTISYPVGKPLMWADGKAVTIDVPAQIDPDISKTFLPIRNIAETLGFKVDWDNKAKEVVLTPGTGKAQTRTTAQQTRPTTPTPTQNKNLAWVTASGQKIPKPEELPKEKLNPDGSSVPDTLYRIRVKAEDLTHNPNGSLTYFKGTVLEYTTGVPFKKVDTIAQRPNNWSIFKENKNDPRTGTAIVTKGHPEYDNTFNKREKLLISGNPEPDYKYNIRTLEKYGKGNITEISKEEFKSQLKDFNRGKSGKEGLKEIDFLAKADSRVFDATGVIDVSPIGIHKMSNKVGGISWSLLPSYYITTDGGVIARHETDEYVKKHGNFTIDKVIFKAMAYYIIDIPNINHKDYLDKNNYNCNVYVIGNYTDTKLAK